MSKDLKQTITKSHTIKSLESCTLACKKTIDELQLKQQKELQGIVFSHLEALEKAGLLKVVETFMKQDAVATLVELNVFLKAKDTKKVILAILKDVSALYKKRRPYINQIIECYLKNCDEHAITVIKGALETIVNLANLFGDAQIQKQLMSIRADAIENAEYAMSLLKQTN